MRHFSRQLFISMLALVISNTALAECAPSEVCEDGWTNLQPSMDSRIVYVSSSEGSDLNDGLSPSSPRRNIQRAHDELLRDGYPDWLLFKSGDIFDSTTGSQGNVFLFWGKGGRSSSEPMVIGSYGSGARPLLSTGPRSAFYSSAFPTPKAHLAITDLEMYPDSYAGYGHITGITLLNGWSDVLIENCRIREYSLNVSIQAVDPGEVNIPSNIRLRRNVITDAYSIDNTSSGIFVGGSRHLLVEENIIDHNGWKEGVAAPGNQSHNTYFHSVGASDGRYRGNIVARAAAHGLNLRGGGVGERNLIVGNPVGIPAHAMDFDDSLVLSQNVVLDVRSSPDPWIGEGIVVEGTHLTIDDNIVAHAMRAVPNMVGIHAKVGLTARAEITNNIIYNWTAPIQNAAWANLARVDGNLPPGGSLVFRRNELQQAVRGNVLETYFLGSFLGTLFAENTYFSHSDPAGSWYSAWQPASGEINGTYRAISYPDPNRNVSTYMSQQLDDPAGLDLFLAAARAQSRRNWRNEYTAEAVINYIRAGFDREPLSPLHGPTQPEEYSISVKIGLHGSVFPSGVNRVLQVKRGESQTFEFLPDVGFKVKDVVIDSREHLGPIEKFTFNAVQASHSLEVHFAAITRCEALATLDSHNDVDGDGRVTGNDIYQFAKDFEQCEASQIDGFGKPPRLFRTLVGSTDARLRLHVPRSLSKRGRPQAVLLLRRGQGENIFKLVAQNKGALQGAGIRTLRGRRGAYYTAILVFDDGKLLASNVVGVPGRARR